MTADGAVPVDLLRRRQARIRPEHELEPLFDHWERGYDAGKKIKGRQRHLLVDTLGLVLNVVAHAADIQDRDGAKLVLKRMKEHFSKLAVI